MIYRVFVEKRKGFGVKAKKLSQELANVLGIKTPVRIFLRYDMEGAEADFVKSLDKVFSEPPADRIYKEKLPKKLFPESKEAGKGMFILCTEFLPGQYDQRADLAAQCVQMLTQGEKPKIRCATVYVFDGITEKEFEKIKGYIINPVESRICSMDKPKSLAEAYPEAAPEQQETGFIDMSDAALADFQKSGAYAFSVADLKFIRDFFKIEGRDPFKAELKILEAYWSDHCRHTTFNTELKSIKIESNIPEVKDAYDMYRSLFEKHYGDRDDKYPCLMSMATIGAKELESQGQLPLLDKSEEINACSIKVDADIDGKKEPWIVMFKNETHNHPTEIEPFGGAATCLGGGIRDPLSGRVYVYQAMRVTGAADIKAPFSSTLKGKLPQRAISTVAAAGYSSYGNQVGVASGLIKEIYHPGFAAKRMEAGFLVAAAPAGNVVRSKPLPGDLVLLIGEKTGRDGCGGATGSSKEQNEQSIELCGAEVQKGNAMEERKLLRLFANPAFSRLVKRCNDFGAGGVSVAVGELSSGMDINLDNVPKKYRGLSGTELAISESQERMAVVIAASDLEKVKGLCAEQNVALAQIAVITDLERMRIFFKGQIIADLKRSFLDTNGVRQTAAATITDKAPVADKDRKAMYEKKEYAELTKKILSEYSSTSQKGLGQMFDSTIGASTVLMPFGGKKQLTPTDVMVAKLPVGSYAGTDALPNAKAETDTATVGAYGFYPYLSSKSPFAGAVAAVASSVIKCVISGASYDSIYLSFQEFFEKLREEPSRWGKPTAALLGALHAQMSLGKAAIGGKDSMSGSFESLDVPPTLISFALGMAQASRVISNTAKTAGSTVYRYKLKRSPSFIPDLENLQSFLRTFETLIQNKEIEFAAIAEEGGAVSAIAKSLFGEGLGFKCASVNADLFEFLPGDIIFAVKNKSADVNALIKEFDCDLTGTVTAKPVFEFDSNNKVKMAELEQAFTSTFEDIYPTSAKVSGTVAKCDYYAGPKVTRAARITRPRVFIPVFPGTNCEYDSVRAFEKAGASVETFVVKNMTAADVAQSVAELGKRISKCNIFMLPGGFSGGDEPDGSGKFIAAALSSAPCKDAISELLRSRDGLILGICNGFQALVKLGLLPYGDITPATKDCPTLTYNTISNHVSQIAYVRVASNLSPWLAAVKPGEVYCQPVSHGEGRFVASKLHLKRIIEGGQVAMQYADLAGQPTMKSPFNPNGSALAVEALCSPDGRILGKMGHSERVGKDILKNVPGCFDIKLFESGVKYFD